jgi:hypothetical protein
MTTRAQSALILTMACQRAWAGATEENYMKNDKSPPVIVDSNTDGA